MLLDIVDLCGVRVAGSFVGCFPSPWLQEETFEEHFVEAGKQRISPKMALEFYRRFVIELAGMAASFFNRGPDLGGEPLGYQ